MTQDEREHTEARTLRDWRTKVYFESQAEFAKRLHVDKSVLSLWENDVRVPQYRTRRKIALALGVRPDQIIFSEGKDSLANVS